MGPCSEGRKTERRQERQTAPCPCDSADLTGLGLSAAVPLAFVRIAGENSIPVWEAIYSPTQGEVKLVNLITCSVPPVCYFNAGTVTLCPWVTNLHWVTAKQERQKKKQKKKTRSLVTYWHVCAQGCEAGQTPWGRKLFICGSNQQSHIELRGPNGTG